MKTLIENLTSMFTNISWGNVVLPLVLGMSILILLLVVLHRVRSPRPTAFGSNSGLLTRLFRRRKLEIIGMDESDIRQFIDLTYSLINQPPSRYSHEYHKIELVFRNLADKFLQRNLARNPFRKPDFSDDDIIIKKKDDNEFSLYMRQQNITYTFTLEPEYNQISYIDQLGNNNQMPVANSINISINGEPILDFELGDEE